MKLLTWYRIVNRAGLFGKFVKIVPADFGHAYNTFQKIQSDDFFLSRRRFAVHITVL